MQSARIPGRVYEVTTEVAECDQGGDGEEYVIDDRAVLRGVRDLRYDDVRLHWLYDDAIQRVGALEVSLEDPSDVSVLWYYECPFATFFQEPGWNSLEETLWSQMDGRAYEYCLAHGIATPEAVRDFCERRGITIVTPESLMEKKPIRDVSRVYCIDENFILYQPPSDSRLFTPRDDDGSAPQPPAPESASAREA